MNAVRTGLWCKDIVVEELGERQDEFEVFVGEYMKSLDPHGAAEEMIVHRLAVAEWRMRRAARFEAASVRRQLFEIDRGHRDDLLALGEKHGELKEKHKEVKREIKVVEGELRKEAIDWDAVYEVDWTSSNEELRNNEVELEYDWNWNDGDLVHAYLRDEREMSDKEVLEELDEALCQGEESKKSQIVDNDRKKVLHQGRL